MPVSEIKKLTSKEIGYWRAFYGLSPFGTEQGNINTAKIIMVLAEINRNHKIKREPFKLSDFYKDPFLPEDEPTVGELLLKARTIQSILTSK